MSRINPDDPDFDPLPPEVQEEFAAPLSPELAETLARLREMYEKVLDEIEARPRYYRLDENNEPVPLQSVFEFSAVLEDREALVTARTYVVHRWQRAEISTVFLSLDHSFSTSGPPVLWETMVFGETPLAEYQDRYTSHQYALLGHAATVALVLARITWNQRGTIPPTPRRRRLCERSGHPLIIVASNGSKVCARCGTILYVSLVADKVVVEQFERHHVKKPKQQRREKQYQKNLMKMMRRDYRRQTPRRGDGN